MPDTYVTSQGDRWDLIAYRTLGSEKYMHHLIEANKRYREVVTFPANIRLVVPAIATPVSDSLPPWKRGASS
jgi:hypothetical protein